MPRTTLVKYFLSVAAATPSGSSTMIKDETKPKILRRLSRVAGQVNGLQKMVEEDRYCVDILTQVAAARSALDAVGAAVLAEHISGCLVGHGTASEHEQAKAKTPAELEAELHTLLARLLA